LNYSAPLLLPDCWRSVNVGGESAVNFGWAGYAFPTSGNVPNLRGAADRDASDTCETLEELLVAAV
jgi:hypothetical protein